MKLREDFLELLARLARENNDATCQAAFSMLERGDGLGDVVYELLTALSGEKAQLTRMVTHATSLMATPPVWPQDPAAKDTSQS